MAFSSDSPATAHPTRLGPSVAHRIMALAAPVIGPAVYPPPGGVTLATAGTNMVTAGGMTWTYTGFNLKLENALYWGPSPSTVAGYPSPADLSFDGTISATEGGMTYDAIDSNLAGGIEIWKGSVPFNGGTSTTRLTITATTTASPAAPIPFVDGAGLGLGAAGAVLRVTGDFKVNLLMEATNPPGVTFGAPAPMYDAWSIATMQLPTSGGRLKSSFDGGFYVQQPLLLTLPAMANAAYGGYTTATYLQNTGPQPANVVVKYFDQTGAAVGTGDTATVAPNATTVIRQDNGNSFASTGAGSALLYSDQPLASFVNEFAPGNVGDATSYSGIPYSTGAGTTIYAPAIANNAYGGYTTGIGLVNLGITPANLTITYRDLTGTVQLTQTLTAVPAGAYQGVYSGTAGLPNGFAGTATISTSTPFPVAAIVNETGPGGQFSSYSAVPAGNATLDAPVALRNAYGGYNTGMGIQNTSATAGTVNITYYDSAGTPTTTTHAITADGYLGVYQGTDIPADGAYTAVITTPTAGVTLAAIVNEVAPGPGPAHQSTSYNTLAGGTSTVDLPLVESAGSDGWSTGEGIMNTGSATTVTVAYFDLTSGMGVGTPQVAPLAPNAFWGVYQPAGGLPTGTRATAVITTAPGGQVVVVTNESNATTFMSYDGVGH